MFPHRLCLDFSWPTESMLKFRFDEKFQTSSWPSRCRGIFFSGLEPSSLCFIPLNPLRWCASRCVHSSCNIMQTTPGSINKSLKNFPKNETEEERRRADDSHPERSLRMKFHKFALMATTPSRVRSRSESHFPSNVIFAFSPFMFRG
jgi:hypothetical protein